MRFFSEDTWFNLAPARKKRVAPLSRAIAVWINKKYAGLEGAYWTILCLGGLLLIGSVLRLYNLDALGLAHDESIQGVAVKGILTHGYPVLGSGQVYVRALPYLYLEAFFALLLGWGEMALRLPSVLFNLATIPLMYAFTRALLDKQTALVAATIATFSAWEIEFSRVARMYTAFQFFYLLSLYTFYRGYVENHRLFRYATIPAFFLTFTIHQLSFPLVFTFILLAVLHGYQVLKNIRIWVYTSICIAIYYLYWRYVSLLFPKSPVFDTVFDRNETTTLLIPLFSQVLANISIPSLVFFEQLIGYHLYIFWIPIFCLALTLCLWYKSVLKSLIIFRMIMFILILLCCFFHQIGLASLVFAILLLSNDIESLNDKSNLLPLGVILISFIAWFGYALYNSEWYFADGSFIFQSRRIFSILLDYPHIYDKHLHFLLSEWLGFSIWTFIGIILLLICYLREPLPSHLYVTGICYIFPLISISLFGETENRPRFFFTYTFL
jgi:uncharacterized membrane protein